MYVVISKGKVFQFGVGEDIVQSQQKAWLALHENVDMFPVVSDLVITLNFA